MNKYKQFSKLPIPNIGEIALAYGVHSKTDKYRSQSRPFLVIDKDIENNILALKLTTQNKNYKNYHQILSSDYDYPTIMPKNSYVDSGVIYHLGTGDFISKGFKVQEQFLKDIYHNIIFEYINNRIKSNVTEEEANYLYKKYLHKYIKPTDIIRVAYYYEPLLVYGRKDGCYKCIRLYHNHECNNIENTVVINNYIYNFDYNETIYIPKNDALFKIRYENSPSIYRIINQKQKLDKQKNDSLKLSLK